MGHVAVLHGMRVICGGLRTCIHSSSLACAITSETTTESDAESRLTVAIWLEPQPKCSTAIGWKVATTVAFIETSSSAATAQKSISVRRLKWRYHVSQQWLHR